MSDSSERVPAEAFHPWEFIQDELDWRGWSRDRLAHEMGGDYGLTRLALDFYADMPDEQVKMDDMMAKQFGKAFSMSPDFFLNLQDAWFKWKGWKP